MHLGALNLPTLRALAYILQMVGRNDGTISLNQLLLHRRGIRRDIVTKAWDLLLGRDILETLGTNGHDYGLVGLKEGTVPDFLVIWMRKKARVSAAGHRSVRVAAQVMALHDGVIGRACGSMIWKEKVPMPKYRLRPVRVLDLLHRKQMLQHFRVDTSKPTHVQFKLDFDPPLSAGEIVEYGFYVWNRNYYSRSRKEALRLYKDEWIREGLGVNGPAFDVNITVQLPEEYRYQDCRLEKGTSPSASGPASPGEVLSGLQHDEKTLNASLQAPSPGNYYVCWIPPE